MKSVTIIKGITKVESVRGFVYNFPLQVIETITDDNYLIRRERGNSSYEQIRFVDLDNNLGALDIEGYADLLCEGGYFRDSDSVVPVANEIKDGRGSGETYSDYETETLALAKEQKRQLDQMIFLLKNIAE